MKPLNDKVYDIIKWIALLVLPTLLGAIVAISEVWSVQIDGDIIAGLTALSSAIGVLLSVSSTIYYVSGKVDVAIPSMPVKVYKVLQDITLYWLPAFATAYYILSMFVRMHRVIPVVETAIIIQVFLGLILGIYSTQNGNLNDWVTKNLSEVMSRVSGRLGGPRA